MDTGSAVSIMSLNDINRIFSGRIRLRRTRLLLRTYTGEEIEPAGAVMVQVNVNGETLFLKLYVVHNHGKPLFGRQ